MTATQHAVIRGDREAVDAARLLAEEAREGAAERDANRVLPWSLLDRFSAAGLAGITVPRAHGGADVSVKTLVEVFIELADADPALAQIPQNHFAVMERLRLHGTAEQQAFFYPRFLAGDRLGNATAEPGDKRPNEHATAIRPDPAGRGYRITGRKVYSTGALFAQWIPVSAVDERGQGWVVFAPRESAGIEVIDDWDSFGQRTTASGTVVFDDVPVDALYAFPSAAQVKGLDTTSSVSQLIHAAIDLGIARRAIADTIRMLKANANPARGSGARSATEDTLTLREIGKLKLHYTAAEVLLTRAAQAADAARVAQDQALIEQTLIAVTEAKILTTEISLEAGSKLFELVGTHSTLNRYALDRHWRNARTHTLHDGVRWKYVALGQYHLNDLIPDPWAFGHPYRPSVAAE
ncbi:SfnB family sulfur acquisition oxidoreductase [Comamonadaceae bacterium PP-2]